MNWKTIHLDERTKVFSRGGETLFSEKNIINALKFHAPGLAPVEDCTGWYFINENGEELNTQRYDRAFGFYHEKAAVVKGGDWWHIDSLGEDLYSEKYQWCGNYQEEICTVQSHDNSYFHIDKQGKPIYSKTYQYAGDFKYGYACVTRKDGRCSHIDQQGELLHGQWFKNLGVYHKGFATAQDETGWFHIDLQGKPIYFNRFLSLEPFYNGKAFAISLQGKKVTVDESGNVVYL